MTEESRPANKRKAGAGASFGLFVANRARDNRVVGFIL